MIECVTEIVNEVNKVEDKKGMDRLMKLILGFNALERQQQDEVLAYLQGHVAAYKLFKANKREGVTC